MLRTQNIFDQIQDFKLRREQMKKLFFYQQKYTDINTSLSLRKNEDIVMYKPGGVRAISSSS